MKTLSLEDRLVEFLRGVTGQAALSGDTELLEDGIADSLTMMDLMVFIETELKVRLDFADLNADVFRTPATLAALIAARQEPSRRVEAA
ncbi:MAG: acyl carrier protein [Deltaproteobacteria bacterium]